jgi:hypothetical protein
MGEESDVAFEAEGEYDGLAAKAGGVCSLSSFPE